MVGREPDFGATATTVAANVERLREMRELTYTQLSARLKEAGSQITPVGVRRIENGERRVTVDDLVALAVALDVSPVTLLMPASENREDMVTATAITDACAAEDLWKWLRADRPLVKPLDGVALLGFVGDATPVWRVREYAEGVLKILEVDRLPDEIELGGDQAAKARERLAEMNAEMKAVDDGED